jgi:hypothetical protein
MTLQGLCQKRYEGALTKMILSTGNSLGMPTVQQATNRRGD